MKIKKISILIILLSLILQSCSTGTIEKKNIDNKNKKIYVSNYTDDMANSEILVVDENLSFLETISSTFGKYLNNTKSKDSYYSYGASKNILKIDNKNKKKEIIELNSDSIIREIFTINNETWAINNGYFTEGNQYESQIINIEENKSYVFQGYPVSYIKHNTDIFIGVKNTDSLNVDLLKFNTVTKKIDRENIYSVKDYSENVSFKLIPLNDNILMINSNNFDVYKIKVESLNSINKIGNLNYFIPSLEDEIENYLNCQIYEFWVDLDENNLLIGINTGMNIKLLKINKLTGYISEILKGVGNTYIYSSSPIVDNEYIYISFINQTNLSKIKKYNWKTNELLNEINLEDKFSGYEQIGNLLLGGEN